MKNQLRTVIAVFVFLGLHLEQTLCQQSDTSSYFPLGVWGVWIDYGSHPYTGNLTTGEWNNEYSNWQQLYGNYLVYYIPVQVEDEVMQFADNNDYKMDIAGYDKSNQSSYDNSLEGWVRNSSMADTNTAIALIDTLYSRWQGHQGWYNYTFGSEFTVSDGSGHPATDRWPLVEFVSQKIHQIDPQRKSATDAPFSGNTGDFLDACPSLDVLRMDVYFFNTGDPMTYSAQQSNFDNCLQHYDNSGTITLTDLFPR